MVQACAEKSCRYRITTLFTLVTTTATYIAMARFFTSSGATTAKGGDVLAAFMGS